MYAVKDKAEVNRTAVLEMVKEDQAKPDPVNFGSNEAQEMETALAKVMPTQVASELTNIVKSITKAKTAKDAVAAVVSLIVIFLSI